MIMTSKELKLLFTDVCSRLPHGGVYVQNISKGREDVRGWLLSVSRYAPISVYIMVDSASGRQEYSPLMDIRPYLRSMSSMTGKERKEYEQFFPTIPPRDLIAPSEALKLFEWLGSHFFDYHDLIKKGLALEAPTDMYEEELSALSTSTRNYYQGLSKDQLIDLLIKRDERQSRFKVGDWIVQEFGDTNEVSLITEIIGDDYILDIGKWPIAKADTYARLWTIEDAKEGDILVDNSFPFIFKSRVGKVTSAYCGIDASNEFRVSADTTDGSWTWMTNIRPATKEEKDLLFDKMDEAGYEWNSESLELRQLIWQKNIF